MVLPYISISLLYILMQMHKPEFTRVLWVRGKYLIRVVVVVVAS